MPRWRDLPPSLRFLCTSVLATVALLTALRLAFFWAFSSASDPAPFGDSVFAFYLGVKLDLRLVLWMHAPLLLLALLPGLGIDAPLGPRIWLGYLTSVLTLVLLAHVVDFAHFAYLSTRLDATLLRFLADPVQSATMVWESYPVVWLLVLLAAGALAQLLFLEGVARRSTRTTARRAGLPVWRRAAPYAVAALLFAGGIYGKLSYYPLRWSDAFFTSHPFTSMLALDPVLYFLDTLKNKEVDADPDEARRYYASIARYLGVAEADRDADRLVFHRATGPAGRAARTNVVVVLLESFGFYKTGFSGNPLAPTPHFDAMARRSVVFSRFYTPHGGTARGVFATLVGLPDVELQKTSSRNPTVVRQHTLVNAFEGYDKLYFLGGSASWGNIRGLLAHNVPGLEIYEEGSYASPREDVWGISDLHLFEEANRVLRERRDRPFFAVIQTAGNHAPYTIPSDRRGFEPRDLSDEEVARYGFRSAAAYDSFRYLDHSLGVFLRQARAEPYFEDTLFVFLGDHGLERNAEHRPAGEQRLGLTRFHVPLVLYSPKLLPDPVVYDKVGSQVDVLPTIAGALGLPVLNTTLGRDLFDARFDGDRYAFTIRHTANPRIGVIGRDHYLTVSADGGGRSLHEIFSPTPREDVAERLPEVADQLEALARGLYQTARYMRQHNRPEDVAGARPPLGHLVLRGAGRRGSASLELR